MLDGPGSPGQSALHPVYSTSSCPEIFGQELLFFTRNAARAYVAALFPVIAFEAACCAVHLRSSSSPSRMATPSAKPTKLNV